MTITGLIYRDATGNQNRAIHGRSLEALYDGLPFGQVRGHSGRGWVVSTIERGEGGFVSASLSACKQWLQSELDAAKERWARDPERTSFCRLTLKPGITGTELRELLTLMHDLAGGNAAQRVTDAQQHFWVPIRFGLEMAAIAEDLPIRHPDRIFLVHGDMLATNLVETASSKVRLGDRVHLRQHPLFVPNSDLYQHVRLTPWQDVVSRPYALGTRNG